MYFSAKEAIENYIQNSILKEKMTPAVLFGKSIMAGMMIGMGAAASNVPAHSISNVGLARLAAAVVFPIGLMMIILLGAELFTGDCLMVMALPDKKISTRRLIHVLGCVYIGNFVGGFLVALMVNQTGQLDYSAGMLGAYTIKVAIGKVQMTTTRALISGICCNFLVCAAVLMAGCARDVTGKLLVSFFVIMLFVTAGFEHCVANMYYLSAGYLAKMIPYYREAALEVYGIDAKQMEVLSISNILIRNLLPVTVGNIIGGSLLFAMPMYKLSKQKDRDKQKGGKEVLVEDGYHTEYVASATR